MVMSTETRLEKTIKIVKIIKKFSINDFTQAQLFITV